MAPIENAIRDRRLTWYVHVMGRLLTVPIRCLEMQINAKCRRRSRPLKTWIKVVKKDLPDLEIIDGLW